MNIVAVTGATGLLGRHIVEKLLAEGVKTLALHRSGREALLPEEITKRQGDVLDQVSLEDAFEGATTVIHAAALVSYNPRWRKRILEVNVAGTRNVVDACLQSGVKNLIHISSVSALGRKPDQLVNEESKWTGHHSSDYGQSKYLAELEVFRGAEEGLTVCMVNPSLILTASQLHRSSSTLFDYVWKERRFYTDGVLNYVDARDVAETVFQLYKKPWPGEKFLLSAGCLSFQDFFSQVAKHFNKKAPSTRISSSLSYWAGWVEEMRGLLFNQEPLVTRKLARLAVQSFRYDNRKVQELVGVRFRTLEETLDWCCEVYQRNVKTNK